MSTNQPSIHRRTLFRAGMATAAVAAVGRVPAHAAPAARPDIGVAAHPFDLGEVRLTAGRWLDNQNRTLAYLRFVDADRLLHTFRLNAGLPSSAQPCGGWEAPGVELRGHSTGHVLSALAQAYAVTGDAQYRSKGDYLVSALVSCQAASPSRSFHAGYLSAFPENFFDRLESGQGVWAPWYTLHKIMAGLLDHHRLTGSNQALQVVIDMAAWVDWRTARLSRAQMQSTLNTEFGGMNAVLADLCQTTGDTRWLTTAQRFDHAAVFDPLSANTDRLDGLHANTQIPKWIGAVREYKASGTARYRDIATNAWNLTVGAHTYDIGGNSVGEHFKPPNAIAAFLRNDTCENCNTYNMLKLTRELFTLYPNRADLFDYYERALVNQMIGQQNPNDAHGHVCYFTPLNPGGRRGVAPTNGGYSTDYATFWCCQGTGLEMQTKLMDSIYFRDDTTLIVNLFAPSALNWTQRGITVTQTTTYPASDTTSLQFTGNVGGSWSVRVRIPSWSSGATISVNGVAHDVAATPGTYATLTRSWTSGDTVTVRVPMQVALRPANDNTGIAAVTYGPVVLAGNYGNTALSSPPTLNTASITRTSATSLAFTATANGSAVALIPFHDAHGVNYNVYWNTGGSTVPLVGRESPMPPRDWRWTAADRSRRARGSSSGAGTAARTSSGSWSTWAAATTGSSTGPTGWWLTAGAATPTARSAGRRRGTAATTNSGGSPASATAATRSSTAVRAPRWTAPATRPPVRTS